MVWSVLHYCCMVSAALLLCSQCYITVVQSLLQYCGASVLHYCDKVSVALLCCSQCYITMVQSVLHYYGMVSAALLWYSQCYITLVKSVMRYCGMYGHCCIAMVWSVMHYCGVVSAALLWCGQCPYYYRMVSAALQYCICSYFTVFLMMVLSSERWTVPCPWWGAVKAAVQTVMSGLWQLCLQHHMAHLALIDFQPRPVSQSDSELVIKSTSEWPQWPN